jgi:hypothetical protein
MPNVIYEYQIPDPLRPFPEEQRGLCGPSGHLTTFVPEPLAVAELVGRPVEQISTSVGTYGMGGPGFFGLRLGDRWLVVAVWGAAAWMRADSRMIEDSFHQDNKRPAPWISDQGDELSCVVVGRTIASIEVAKHSLRIALNGGPDLVIDESPQARPRFGGSGKLRTFAGDEDLRRALFLFPTDEIWV